MSSLSKSFKNVFDPGEHFFNKHDATAAAAPAITSPPVMPEPDDEAVKRAKRRSIADQMRRRGRASTVLADSGTDTLGA